MRISLFANLAGLISGAMAGVSVVATRFVMPETDAITLSFIRYLIAIACLAPLAAVLIQSHKTSRSDVAQMLGWGVLFFGAFPWFFSLSLEFTTAARGALALATAPIMTLGLASVMRLEAPGLVRVAAILTAFTGVAIALGGDRGGLATAGPDHWKGDLLMLAAAFLAACYAVGAKPLLSRNPALLVTCVSMVGGLFALAIPAIIIAFIDGLPRISGGGWGAVILLGIGGGALQFGLWIWAVSRLLPSQAALYLTFTPIVAMFLAVVLLNEPLTVSLIIGLVLVVAGILGANWTPKPPPTDKIEEPN